MVVPTSDPADPVGLPLRRGDRGPAIQDLRRRLAGAGFHDIGETELFDAATERAVRAFQRSRRLTDDGICGPMTWAAMVESDYRLGDRMLYLRSPMTRGDDVTELQQRLGRLGFDAGWLDGIYGPDTEAAVREFQRNQALTVDGVVGRETVVALDRLSGRRSGEKTVAEVREVERLRALTGDTHRRLVVGEPGGFPVLADALSRRLRLDGAEVLTLHQPDLSDQARAANAWDGAVFIGVTLRDDDARLSYFETEGFVSHGGKALAACAAARLRALLDHPVTTAGMRLPILRETRMPAVWCEIGPPALVVERAPAVADALRHAVVEWCAVPPD